jgi:hypothetical protein
MNRVKIVTMSSSCVDGERRALCFVRNAALRAALKRSLAAAGSAAEFTRTLDDVAKSSARVVFIDREARADFPIADLRRALRAEAEVVFLGESLADEELLALLGQVGAHVISDSAEEAELLTTLRKLLSGEIFGLEPYLAPGTFVHERTVHEPGKHSALTELGRYARTVGARRAAVSRIESVADELLLGALSDAPGRGFGRRAAGSSPAFDSSATAVLRYACDGLHFGLAVIDQRGALEPTAIVEHLQRARSEGGRPRTGGDHEDRLGLYLILARVTRFIANIDPGTSTELICLFDLRHGGRQAASGARSVHIFTT